MMKRKHYKTIAEYLEDFEGVTKERLGEIRNVISAVVPKGTIEKISYNIPCFRLNDRVVYFAGYAKHVSVYPVPKVSEELAKQVSKYQKGKGTLQFPHDEPLPVQFIKKIVQRLVQV